MVMCAGSIAPAQQLAVRFATIYDQLIDRYFNSDYQSFISVYKDYLDDIGVAQDVKDDLIRLYSPKLFNSAPPPAMFICSKRILDRIYGSAFYDKGCIFLCNDSTDWNGDRFTATHEAGHYFDHNMFRGDGYNKRGTQSKINDANERIKQRLTQRNARFKLFGREFTLLDWKRGFIQTRDRSRCTPDFYNWLSSEIESHFGVARGSNESKEIIANICDTFQSIFGFTFGAGHKRSYNMEKSDTSVEAVANIVSMINNGYDFMREPLMELYDEIYKEMN